MLGFYFPREIEQQRRTQRWKEFRDVIGKAMDITVAGLGYGNWYGFAASGDFNAPEYNNAAGLEDSEYIAGISNPAYVTWLF